MKTSRCIKVILFSFVMFFSTNFAVIHGEEKLWTGNLGDGTEIDEEGLKRIISEHEEWVKTTKKDGQRANLKKADIRETDLRGANLQGANLSGANLKKADIRETDLKGANLQGANLTGAKLQGADLQNANLWGANLQGANFWLANLQEADLQHAILRGARLWYTNLQEAKLGKANLQKADLEGANLKGTMFEIEPNNLPDIPPIALAKNLSLLKYSDSPHALVELRTEFKKYGLRKQEREITYAIKRSGYENALKKGNLLTKIEVILGWIFFEKTCKWGMSPKRPIFILLGLIFFFTIPYAKAIYRFKSGKFKADGIWKVWIPNRRRKDLGKDRPEEILDSINPLFCFKNGFYFSILSAFNIGWRELNVGNWITRIQPYEYRFYASGWVRSVSGIQSIISVYLLALSVLTYFGRPFESY
jgi:hypothetical protein